MNSSLKATNDVEKRPGQLLRSFFVNTIKIIDIQIFAILNEKIIKGWEK